MIIKDNEFNRTRNPSTGNMYSHVNRGSANIINKIAYMKFNSNEN
jgi:hypothetical protein